MSSNAKQTAVKLLARREHSEAEICHKLQQRDFEQDEITQAVVELKQGGWLSDERYTEVYIRSRRQKGFGPVRIAMELRERGVDESIVSQHLQPEDDIWQQTLCETYRRKYRGTACKDYAEKAKRMRFLQYRGFASDEIHKVVK